MFDARLTMMAALCAFIGAAEAADTTPVPEGGVGDAGASLYTGGWSHVVPLELPAASNGMVPGLAMVADHRVPDGPLGAGWRLEGFSRIERRSATNGTPDMSFSDVYYVDGMRLYSNGAGGYVPERDDNRVFVFSTSQNRWDVYRDGWQWRYGEFQVADTFRGLCATETREQSPDAPCETTGQGEALIDGAAAHTTAWNLSRTRDPNNNDVVINYTSNTALDATGGLFGGEYAYQHVPWQVQYASGKHVAMFEYASRPDALVDGRSGRMRVLPVRLQAIQVKVNATVTPVDDARYELAYLDEDATACPGEGTAAPDPEEVDLEAASVLRRIYRESSSSPTADRRLLRCIETNQEAVSFDTTPIDLNQPSTLYSDQEYQVHLPSVVNFDGDAFPDLVSWSYACEGAGDETTSCGTTVLDNYSNEVVCLTIGDICTVRTSYWENADDGTGNLALSSLFDDGIDTVETWHFETPDTSGTWKMADVNRDGATDLIVLAGDGYGLYIASTWLGGPEGFEGPDDTLIVGDPAEYGDDLLTVLASAQFVDVDGDGFVDAVLPGATIEDDTWVRNSGRASGTGPYLDFSEAERLPLVSPLSDPLSDAFDELDTLTTTCSALGGHGQAPEFVGTLLTGLQSGEAVYADVNGDGLVDQLVSYHPCWDLDDPDLTGYAPTSDLFSRVFYGDGQGRFHDSALQAGAAFENGWNTTGIWNYNPVWSVVDLDRSGRTEILWPVPQSEYTDDVWTAPDMGLPAGFGLEEGGLVCPHAVCDDALVMLEPLTTNVGSLHRLIADWDGDGFDDILSWEKTTSDPMYLYRNLRAVARNRVTSIHDAWGGEIAVTYASSALAGANPDLPYVLDVIASVDGEYGLTEFQFDGGYTHDGRFMGFASAQVAYESGRTSALTYGTSPALAGELVTRTERRRDGTIASLTLNQYFEVLGGGATWRIDNSAPYFNPIRRQCTMDVEPGFVSGVSVLQTTDEGKLVEACAESGITARFRGLEWGAALGWIRASGDSAADELAQAVWANGVLEWGSNTASAEGWPVADYLGGREDYPAVDGSVPMEVPVPTTPTEPGPVGTSPTAFDIYLKQWGYNSDQRLEYEDDKRDVTLSGDDVYTDYELGTWDSSARGQRLVGIEWTDGASTVLRTVENSDFATFDRPRHVVERGVGSVGTREWNYTYAKGEVLTVEEPDGGVTTYTRNSCGQPTQRTDAEGRVWAGTYTTACRLTDWTWEGSTGSITYDSFGRMNERTVTARPGATAQVESWLRDDVLDVADDRETHAEPRSALILGDGTLRLNHLDPWGRPYYQVVCEAGTGAGTGVSAVLAETQCVTGTERYQLRAWSVDGQPRMETASWADGDTAVASAWTYRDAFGRPEVRLDPAPEEITAPSAASWVESTLTYGLGERSVTDPGGHACTTTRSGMNTDTACGSAYRGGFTIDRLGRVVSEESADHVVTELSYDSFGRLGARALDSAISVFPSTTSALDEGWTWTPGGRLATHVDVAGNEQAWSYDALGRPTAATYTPYAEPPTTVNTWSYQDYVSGLGRWVTSTDINGNPTKTWLDGLDRAWKVDHPSANQALTHWDAAGRVADTTDIDGQETVYTWNPDGTLAEAEDTATSVVRSYTYDGAGQRMSATDRDGVVTEYGWTWDGRPAWTQRVRTGTAGAWTLSEYTYDDDGQVDWARQDGTVTTYEYDALHRLSDACVGMLSASDCGIDLAWTWTDADQVHEVTRGTGMMALTTTYSYNDVGWLVGVEHPDANTESWEYDKLGLLRKHEDESTLGSAWDYDAWGRVVTEELPGRDPRTYAYTFGVGLLEEHVVTEADGGVWTTWYDWAGRAVREEAADYTVIERDYVGTQLTQERNLDNTPAVLARTSYTYDALGHLETRWGPVDEADWLTQGGVPDADDYVHVYTHSPEGRVETIEGPENYASNLTTFTWEDGVLTGEAIDGVTDITYGYATDYPRRIHASMGLGTGPTRDISRLYEERGLWVSTETFEEGGDTLVRTFEDWDVYGTPRRAIATLNSVEQSDYQTTTDSRGRVASVSVETLGMAVGTVSYDYANNGQIAGVSVAGGMSATSGVVYNRSGGVLDTIVKSGTTDVLAAFTRDTMGRPTQIDLPTATVTLGWDTMGRIETLGVDNGVDAADREYVYDARGRLASLQTKLNGTPERTEEYDYAEPGWLVGERKWAGTGSEEYVTYTHDPAGNRIARDDGTTLTESVYGSGNLLSTVDINGAGAVAVSWDAYGGMLQDHRGWGLFRGPDGGELALADPSNVVVYELVRDALGRQVGVLDTEASFTVWGNPEADLPLLTIDETGATVLNVAAEGLLLGQLRDGVATEAVSDLAGSLIAFDGELLELPGAFGDDAVARTTTTGTERHVYAGLAMLPDAPYQLARQRLYDPELGRFASMDPIGLEGGDHRFNYGNGDPVGFVDPEGLSADAVAGFHDRPAEGAPMSTRSARNFPEWVKQNCRNGQCTTGRMDTDGGGKPDAGAREMDAENEPPANGHDEVTVWAPMTPGQWVKKIASAIWEGAGAIWEGVGSSFGEAFSGEGGGAGGGPAESTGAGEHRQGMAKGNDDFGEDEAAGPLEARGTRGAPSDETRLQKGATSLPIVLSAPTLAEVGIELGKRAVLAAGPEGVVVAGGVVATGIMIASGSQGDAKDQQADRRMESYMQWLAASRAKAAPTPSTATPAGPGAAGAPGDPENDPNASGGGAAALSKLKGVKWGYSPRGCEKVAAKIQRAIGGEIRTIEPGMPGAKSLGARSGTQTYWANHQVVLKEGRVYDAMTGPEGLSVKQFKAQWEYADAIDFGF